MACSEVENGRADLDAPCFDPETRCFRVAGTGFETENRRFEIRGRRFEAELLTIGAKPESASSSPDHEILNVFQDGDRDDDVQRRIPVHVKMKLHSAGTTLRIVG